MCEVVEISDDDDESECIQLYAGRESCYAEANKETNSIINLNDELEDVSPVDRKKVVEILILL